MYLLGGYNGEFLSDFWHYDFGKRTFPRNNRKVECKWTLIRDNAVTARSGHCMVLYDNMLILCGGENKRGAREDILSCNIGILPLQLEINFKLKMCGEKPNL
jgi:hypothetical protein